MARSGRPWIGQLGLRLSLSFVAVALAAVAGLVGLSSVTIADDVHRLVDNEQQDLTGATAIAAAAAYGSAGWKEANLIPLTDLVAQAGANVLVTNMAGRPIHASPGFMLYGTGRQLSREVVVRGRKVGIVTVRFSDKKGLGAAIDAFETQLRRISIGAAGVAALLALLVALEMSRRITAPVDKIIAAARDRASGRADARVGDVRGFGEIRELAAAYDTMAESVDYQERVRRNLVADVAHELRTPIAVLQAGHEAMLDGMAEPTSEYLSSLRDEVLRLARMVDDLQRLAAAEAAGMQLVLTPADLAATVAVVADSLEDTFDSAGINFRRRLSKVQVLCDPLRMHEIASNLLTNAIKFTPAGGDVVIETGPVGGPSRGRDQGLAMLRVSDTGIGIPPEELPHVAERFFRGQRSSGIAGSGIGLTIVAELVRAQHGTFQIESDVGQGTRATITLPRT